MSVTPGTSFASRKPRSEERQIEAATADHYRLIIDIFPPGRLLPLKSACPIYRDSIAFWGWESTESTERYAAAKETGTELQVSIVRKLYPNYIQTPNAKTHSIARRNSSFWFREGAATLPDGYGIAIRDRVPPLCNRWLPVKVSGHDSSNSMVLSTSQLASCECYVSY